MRIVSPTPIVPLFVSSEARFVYIGVANLDPRDNPVELYYDVKHTRRAPNPFPLLDGFNSFRGAQSNLYASEDVSLLIVDGNDDELYSAPFASIIDVADLIAQLITALTVRYVLKAGDVMTGPLAVADAENPNDIYSRSQLDDVIESSESATFVIKTSQDWIDFLNNVNTNDYTYTFVLPGITAIADFSAYGARPTFPTSCAKLWSSSVNPGTLKLTLPSNGAGGIHPLTVVAVANQQLVRGIQTVVEDINFNLLFPAYALTVQIFSVMDAQWAILSRCNLTIDLSLVVSSAHVSPVIRAVLAQSIYDVATTIIFNNVFYTSGNAIELSGTYDAGFFSHSVNCNVMVMYSKTATPPKTLSIIASNNTYVEINKRFDASGKILSTGQITKLAGEIISDPDDSNIVAPQAGSSIFLAGMLLVSQPSRSQKPLSSPTTAQLVDVSGMLKSSTTLRIVGGSRVSVASAQTVVDLCRKVVNSSIGNKSSSVAIARVVVGTNAGVVGVSSNNNDTIVYLSSGSLFYSKNDGSSWSASAINGGINFNSLPVFRNGLWYARLSTGSIISFPDPASNTNVTTLGSITTAETLFDIVVTLNGVKLAMSSSALYKWNGAAWSAYATITIGACRTRLLPISNGAYLVPGTTVFSIIDINGNVVATNTAFGFTCLDIFYSNKILYAVNVTGALCVIRASYDLGTTWTILDSQASAATKASVTKMLNVPPATGTVILKCANAAPFMRRSTDDGATWATIASATVPILAVTSDGGRNAIAFGVTGGVISFGESNDAGATWTWTVTTVPSTGNVVSEDKDLIATIRGMTWIVAGDGAASGIGRRVIPGYNTAFRSSDASVAAANSSAGGWNT